MFYTPQNCWCHKLDPKQDFFTIWTHDQIDGLVQDCSISIANALEILQYCTMPAKYNNIEYNNEVTRLWTYKTHPIAHPHEWAM